MIYGVVEGLSSQTKFGDDSLSRFKCFRSPFRSYLSVVFLIFWLIAGVCYQIFIFVMMTYQIKKTAVYIFWAENQVHSNSFFSIALQDSWESCSDISDTFGRDRFLYVVRYVVTD